MLLSKSNYLIGIQCPKYLWTIFHEKHKIPKADKQTQFRFDQGHLIGELAKSLFKNGIDIPTENFIKNLEESKKLLKSKKILFEPAFCTDKLYSRADILVPIKDKWDIIEVKSSTDVKDVHVQDVAFQKYVYENAGLKINKCFLMHINNEYIRKGEIIADELLIKKDITPLVEKEILLIPNRLEEMYEIIDSEKPSVKIGNCCNAPYDCPLIDDCWSFLPENNVFDLYRGGKKTIELFESGVLAIKEIPAQYELNDKQQIQHICEKTGKPYINKKEIKKFLSKLKEPLYYLDFETYSTAIPLFDGLKPYSNVPFQFSLHVLDKHYSFIGYNDPRREFIVELLKVIDSDGSIIVYNQSFEEGRLRELSKLFPEYADKINSVIKRMVDLLIPFREFSYYNPKQKGSCSIKYVLPALTGKKYNFDEGVVLGFYIPKKHAREKPVYFDNQKNTFIRTGSGDQRATQEEIDAFFRNASFEEKDQELTSFDLKDLDKTTIEQYRNFFVQINPTHRYNVLKDKEFLEKLGIIKEGRVTFAGLLLFGTEDVIAEAIPTYRLEYLEISGISYEDAPTRYDYRISSEKNLFLTFFDVYERLIKKIEIPFLVKQGVRKDDPPHLQALREALVNLIINTDYFSRTNPRIRVFSNRFEFFNPGALPKKIELILKEDFSLPRNPIIAKALRLLRFSENIGSGFHKMINGWNLRYKLKPLIEGDFDFYKIIFPLNKTGTTTYTTTYTTTKTTIKGEDKEKEILGVIENNPSLSVEQISLTVNLSIDGVRYHIKNLKRKGRIKRKGHGKGGSWEILK